MGPHSLSRFSPDEESEIETAFFGEIYLFFFFFSKGMFPLSLAI